jgi:putrescine transport system substrate-binding protein
MTEKVADRLSKRSGKSGAAARVPACVVSITLAIAGVAALSAPLAASAKDTQLNVYNWSDYIAKDTIPNFEKQSGVKVKYDNYDSDDTLQAKLLTGNSGYDIVVPTRSRQASSPRSTNPNSPILNTSILN